METIRRILLVDDDTRLLALLQPLMADYANGRWHIQVASDPPTALGILQSDPIDVLVLDVHMPLVDGVQFLRLVQGQFPDMAKVVLTGDGSGAHRQSCLDSGADLFLEKPRALDGWQVLCATLEQLTRLRGSESGFRGMLRQVELQDVLQMECLARSSSILEIKAGNIQGRIYIQDGAFVHAEAGDITGEEAFNKLLALNRGEFGLHPFSDPPRRTIEGPWEFVLMEAARKRDEMSESAPKAPPEPVAPTTSWTGNALPLEIAPLPAAAILGVQDNPKGSNFRPRIDEVLLCSPRADVLYEWRSHHPEKRVHLMNLLQHKAVQLAESLPLGPVTGLDIEGPLSRFLFHLKPDYFLFVRSTRMPLATDKPITV